MPSISGAGAIARILKREGVEYVFCFPANTLIDAAAAVGIRPIIARSEKALVNMADGFTRATNGRRQAVVVVQQGPGIENAFGAIAQAYADSIPLLVLPGGGNQRKLGIPTGFDPLPSYTPITKWVDRINFPDRISPQLRRAFTLLRAGASSPVVLEVPADIASAQVDEDSLQYTPVRRHLSAGDPADVAEAARALVGAKAPILHVGHGVLWAEATEELRELAELVQAPVMTTMAAKSAFPEDHPLAAGAAGHTVTAAAAHFLKRADLVFGVGCSFTSGAFSYPIPAGKTMVQITVNEFDISKEYPIDVAVVGDARLVLRQVIAEVRALLGANGRRGDDSVASELAAVKGEWLQQWMPRLTSDETPINPYRVIWDLNNTLDRRESIVTHDSGNPRDQMLTFFEAVTPRGYVGWGKSTQLGTGLGIALGSKLAHPEKQVVNVMGDLAFGMAGMDVETAVRERLPIMTVLLNNSRMGGYLHSMPVASERFGSNRLSGHYSLVAEGLGAYSERVERPEEIVPALRRGMQANREGQPAVLEFITREDPVFSQY